MILHDCSFLASAERSKCRWRISSWAKWTTRASKEGRQTMLWHTHLGSIAHRFPWNKPSILGYPYFWKHPYIYIYPKQPGVFLSSYDSKAGNKNLEDFALSFLRKARWKCVQSRKIWPSPSKGNVKGGKMRNMLIMLCFYLPKSDNIVYSISMSIYLLREYLKKTCISVPVTFLI